ncbi:MAG: response regulator transcription factor [Dehalococcoidia bacterium]|nr:response regulator transcription factor [Dehalococcoidia bacterium]
MRPFSESHARSFTTLFDGSPSILVVDPDREYAEIIGDTLNRDRRGVRVAPSARVALEWLQQSPHHAVVLDQDAAEGGVLPGLVRVIRQLQPSIGLVVTSQRRVSVAETVACFDAGADEYIEKPFHPGEFAARVRAVLRRVVAVHAGGGMHAGVTYDEARDVIEVGDGEPPIELDLQNGTARHAGRRLELTATEFTLLRELHQARGHVLSYQTLNGRVLGAGGEEGAARLKSHVSALRQKLRAAGADPDLVRNARGIGYVLAEATA